jgi:DNA-directed RNA polymerase beta subunit
MNREDIDKFLGIIKPAATLHPSVVKLRSQVPETQPRQIDTEEEEFTPVGLDGLLAATEKLLAVNRGLEPTDERDSLVFKRFMTTDKLLAERVKMDADKMRQKTMYALAKQRSLKPLHPFVFDGYSDGMILGNPLTAPLEDINPLHLMEQARRATQMGPGGIGSDNAITEDMQAIHGSQFGFLSTLEGPESEKIGIDTRMAWGSKIGTDGKLYQLFRNRKNGKLRYMSPEDLDGSTVKLPD